MTPSAEVRRSLSMPQLPNCSFACSSKRPNFFLPISKLSAVMSSAGYLRLSCFTTGWVGDFAASGVGDGKIKLARLPLSLPLPSWLHFKSPVTSSLFRFMIHVLSVDLAFSLSALIRLSKISKCCVVSSIRLIATWLLALLPADLSNCANHSSMSKFSRFARRESPF